MLRVTLGFGNPGDGLLTCPWRSLVVQILEIGKTSETRSGRRRGLEFARGSVQYAVNFEPRYRSLSKIAGSYDLEAPNGNP